MRLALVHDWLVTPGGAEDVLRELRLTFPDADVFCLIDFLEPADRRRLGLEGTTRSPLQHMPGVRRHYRKMLPLMPWAIEQLDLGAYDIILSNSHAVAKGVRTREDQLHICHCCSPMRYAWDLREPYLEETGLDHGLQGWLARGLLERVRRWDAENSSRVNAFIAISRYIADRVRRNYGRDSTVIYPPVDTEFFQPADHARENVFVTASRFVPYKRIDLIARAFSRTPDRRLVVIGDGPDWGKVRRAAGPNVTLLGRQPPDVLRTYLQRARAFVFAAEEDFGIAPVEAQACGTPVIAFGRGGATETISGLESAQPTGLFFTEQTEEALIGAMDCFGRERDHITPEACRANAERFAAPRFRREIRTFVHDAWNSFATTGVPNMLSNP